MRRTLRRAVLVAGLVGLLAGTALAAMPEPAGKRLGPYPGLGGCPVFPDPPASLPADAPSLPNQAAWNQNISQAPVASNSEAIISYINSHGGDELHPDFGSPRPYGIPYAVVGRNQPKLPIRYTEAGSESDPGPFPIPRNAPIENGSNSDGDRHVLVVDRARCKLFELYGAHFVSRGRDHWNAGSGVDWNLRSTALRRDGFTSADAAGLPIFPGLIRFDEVQRGRLDHAIRLVVESTRDAWTHPASHCAGDTSSANAPPMGLRLRLKAGYDLGRFSGPAKVIAQAMKDYGFIVADNGSNWYFSGTSDHRWPDGNLNQLKRIPGSAFEVVRSEASVQVC